MGTQPTTDMLGDSSVKGPSEEARAEFSRLASGQQVRSVANALERSGITVSVVDSGEEARRVVRSLLPVGAQGLQQHLAYARGHWGRRRDRAIRAVPTASPSSLSGGSRNAGQ